MKLTDTKNEQNSNIKVSANVNDLVRYMCYVNCFPIECNCMLLAKKRVCDAMHGTTILREV